MSFNHAIRITLPYSDISGIIDLWSARSNEVVVYQHIADDEVSKTHVHLVLGGCEVKAEALKRMYPDRGSGNEFWSWKTWDNGDKFITYMTKGNLDPVYVKNITHDRLDKAKSAWVEPQSVSDKDTTLEYYVKRILLQFPGRPMLIEDQLDPGMSREYEVYEKRLFKEIRDKTMPILWAVRRVMPPATLYKQVAGTAFLRKMEELNSLEQGFRIIRNEWY